jgi:hypothetical protein
VSHTHGPDRYRLQDAARHIDVYDADGNIADGWTGAITGDLSEDSNDDSDTTTGWNSTDHTQRIPCQSAEVGALNVAGQLWRGLANDPNDTINQFLTKGVPQPDHYDIRYRGAGDHGGVHINSSIITFACQLATHGGVSHRAGWSIAPPPPNSCMGW